MSEIPTRQNSIDRLLPMSNRPADIEDNQQLRDAMSAAGDTSLFEAVVISPDFVVPDPTDDPIIGQYTTAISRDYTSAEIAMQPIIGGEPQYMGLDSELYVSTLWLQLARFAGTHAVLNAADTAEAIEHALPPDFIGANKEILLSAVEYRRRYQPGNTNDHKHYAVALVRRDFVQSLANLETHVAHETDYGNASSISTNLRELANPEKRSAMALRFALSIAYLRHSGYQETHGNRNLQIPTFN